MSLETLVDEIRARGEADLTALNESRARDLAAIDAERDLRVEALRREAARTSAFEANRMKAQRVAAAKLAARKLLYAAREERLSSALEATRGLFSEFTGGPSYPDVLRRMYATATGVLGSSVRIAGRAEDAAVLKRVAGKGFDPTPRPILGGLVAETSDGRRRLDLSFDELLRLRGDKVRELLA